MKKLLLVFIIGLFALVGFSQTQSQPETVVINKSDLTPDQLEKIKAAEFAKKVDEYGKWVGVGKEVGVAVREGLGAVVDVADKFGETKVGKITVYLIIWKVIGVDIIRILIGFIFMIVSAFFIYYSLRKTFGNKIMIKGNKLLFWRDREYKFEPADDYDGVVFFRFLHIVFLFATFGITYAIMFA